MFKNIGHFFATLAQKVLAVVNAIDSTEKTVEGVTALIPVYGPAALKIEDVVYGIFGDIAAALTAGQAAAVGTVVTPAYLAAAQDVLAKNAQATALAKATVKPTT